ncbi:MAG: exopolysaccharide biosynthesis protein, partial [Pseudomonadota bacterium]
MAPPPRNAAPSDPAPVTGLEQLIERVAASAERRDRLSVGDVLDAMGPRSFAPLILLAGLIML